MSIATLVIPSRADQSLPDEEERAQPDASANVGPAARHGTSLTIGGRKMKTRILIGIGAGLLGAGFGAGLGWIVQKDGEPFPVYIVVAVAVIFAVCGALAKEKWRQAVEEFFLHVLP